MSTIETILSRMMNDPTFAGAALAGAERTLAEYDLPAEEIAKLKDMSRADFEAFASASPEERKSFSLTSPIRGGGFYQIRDEGG